MRVETRLDGPRLLMIRSPMVTDDGTGSWTIEQISHVVVEAPIYRVSHAPS